jgi:hypothetical protein
MILGYHAATGFAVWYCCAVLLLENSRFTARVGLMMHRDLSEYHPQASFWRQVNGNFFDMAVLDWCKLFGDQKQTPLKRVGEHHWRRVVSDPEMFEARLLPS